MSLVDEVTLVVPAYDRPRLTQGLIDSLAAAGVGCPLVLVDDASPVPLESVLRISGRLPVRIIRSARSVGPAIARNVGLMNACTRYVAFTDNDVSVTAEWLPRLYRHLRAAGSDVAGVGGRVVDDGRNWVGQYCTLLGLLNPYIRAGRVAYLVTANCLFSRDALIRIGGFDERFRRPGGEDPDLSFRLLRQGYRLEYCPEAVVQHHYVSSWLAFYRLFRRYGAGCRMAMQSLQPGSG